TDVKYLARSEPPARLRSVPSSLPLVKMGPLPDCSSCLYRLTLSSSPVAGSLEYNVPARPSGFASQFVPRRWLKFHDGLPLFPRFVMIWITPLDASVPYSVPAAGPLITSMLSM